METQSHPQAPGMSTGKGDRIKGEQSLTPALPFTLCDTRLSRTAQPRREEGLPALLALRVLESRGLLVSVPCSQLWLMGTCV